MPLFAGEEIELTDVSLAILGRWAAMFSYVWEQAEPRLISSTQSAREKLRQAANAVPLYVWRGRYAGERWAGHVGRRMAAYEFDEGEISKVAVTTFGIGGAIFHTCCAEAFSIDCRSFATEMKMQALNQPPTESSVMKTLSDADIERLYGEVIENPRWLNFEITRRARRDLKTLNATLSSPNK